MITEKQYLEYLIKQYQNLPIKTCPVLTALMKKPG